MGQVGDLPPSLSRKKLILTKSMEKNNLRPPSPPPDGLTTKKTLFCVLRIVMEVKSSTNKTIC